MPTYLSNGSIIIDEVPVYIGLRYACLPAGPTGGRLVVFSRTTITALGIEAETITHLAEIPQVQWVS